MDGGTVWNTNIVSAIERCMEIVDDKSKIVVDIALCGHAEMDEVAALNNTLSNIMRARAIKSYYSGMDDIIN